MSKIKEKDNKKRLENLNKVLLRLKGLGLIKKDKDIVDKISFHKSTISSILNGRYSVSDDFVKKFCLAFPMISENEIVNIENGEMLESSEQTNKNLIPFYDDVRTIGGVNELSADTQGVSQPTDYIDAGDWFKEATAAIRHYGDSMTEYPAGCILALREAHERQLIIWGKDYVIETNEYRITKCVQRGLDGDHIAAYSSNEETYPDGRLKHEPLDIAWKDIRRIFLVLGYVVKRNGGTIVFSNQK
jgi:hypothetical protein